MKKILRYAFRVMAFLLTLVVIGLAFVKMRYGLGRTYLDMGTDIPAWRSRRIRQFLSRTDLTLFTGLDTKNGSPKGR